MEASSKLLFPSSRASPIKQSQICRDYGPHDELRIAFVNITLNRVPLMTI